MRMTAREFVEQLPALYPYIGEPEFSFVTSQSGPPVAWRVFRDGGKWWAETKVVGPTGGAWTPAEEVDVRKVVRKYWRDIQRSGAVGRLW